MDWRLKPREFTHNNETNLGDKKIHSYNEFLEFYFAILSKFLSLNIPFISYFDLIEVKSISIREGDWSISLDSLKSTINKKKEKITCTISVGSISFLSKELKDKFLEVNDNLMLLSFCKEVDIINYKFDLSISHLKTNFEWINSVTVKHENISITLSGFIGVDRFEIEESSVISIIPIIFSIGLRFSENKVVATLFCRSLNIENFILVFPELLSVKVLKYMYARAISFNASMEFSTTNVLNNNFKIKMQCDDLIVRDNFKRLFPKATINEKMKCFFEDSHSYFPQVIGTQRLTSISKKFVELLLLSEDPDFNNHKGIDIRLMGNCILINLARKGFYRGGSTITMQLVRNLYLNHTKNIYRKIDEIVIALLLENILMISKSNLLEVYLNVIEFAHDIYGIFDASHYYFSKKPGNLSLKECLVLTYIIPRPKHFVEALVEQSEQLKKNLSRHMNFYSRKLIELKSISSEEANQIKGPLYFNIEGKEIIFEYEEFL
jgi:hypothetical protein